MPLSRSHIRKAAEAYLARHPHERNPLAELLSLLEGDDHPTDRATLPATSRAARPSSTVNSACCTSVTEARGCSSTRAATSRGTERCWRRPCGKCAGRYPASALRI